jgi:hypothetical protein
MLRVKTHKRLQLETCVKSQTPQKVATRDFCIVEKVLVRVGSPEEGPLEAPLT